MVEAFPCGFQQASRLRLVAQQRLRLRRQLRPASLCLPHGILTVVASLLLEALLRLRVSRCGVCDHDTGAVALHRDVVKGDGVEVVGDEGASLRVDAAGNVLLKQGDVEIDHKDDHNDSGYEKETRELHAQANGAKGHEKWHDETDEGQKPARFRRFRSP